MDDSGRLILSEALMDFAKLKDDAVIVGQGDYFEIWSPDLWSQQAVEIQNAESNSHRFAMLNVATRQNTEL